MVFGLESGDFWDMTHTYYICRFCITSTHVDTCGTSHPKAATLPLVSFYTRLLRAHLFTGAVDDAGRREGRSGGRRGLKPAPLALIRACANAASG